MTTANLSIADNETVIQYTSTGESVFPFPFPFLANDEIKVSVDQVDQVLGVDFNLSGLGAAAGGTVTFTSATTSGELITIWQDMPFKRLTGFSTGAAVLAGEALNTEFVRQVRQDQQVRREIGLALRLAVDDPQSGQDMVIPTQTTRAGKVLAFDSSGVPTVLTLVSNEDASLRADLASQAASLGFNLVAITKTEDEDNAGVTVVNANLAVGHVLRYLDNAVQGTTDMITAMQAAHDVVKQAGGGKVQFPFGQTLAQSDTLGVHPTVGLDFNQCRLVALAGFPATIASDKFGGAAGFASIPAPQVWYDGRLGTGICINGGGNGFLDGDGNVPSGLLVTGGANWRLDDIEGLNHTVSNIVYDGPQNSIFSNIRADNAPQNFRLLNAMQLCTLINNNGSSASGDQMEMNVDTDYPFNGAFPGGVTRPTRNTLMSCIQERYITNTKERILHIVEGDENTIIASSFISGSGGAVSVCGIEFGTNTNNNVLYSTQIQGVGEEFPAIINRGFQNKIVDTRLVSWGTTTLVDLIEVYNRMTIKLSHYSGINVTGKHVANKTGSPNDSRLINYTPIVSSGSYAQRPTENIDANMQFYAVDIGLILWDFVNDDWVFNDQSNGITAQTLTGPGAVSLIAAPTYLVTTGADALTLADGIEGQKKYIRMTTDGGVGTLTPTNLNSNSTITFDDVGDTAYLVFTLGEWWFLAGSATLA